MLNTSAQVQIQLYKIVQELSDSQLPKRTDFTEYIYTYIYMKVTYVFLHIFYCIDDLLLSLKGN